MCHSFPHCSCQNKILLLFVLLLCVCSEKLKKKLCSSASCLICPSNHMWQLQKCWTDFHPVWSWYSLKFVYTSQFWLKALNHKRQFIWKPTCSYSYLECSWQDIFQKKICFTYKLQIRMKKYIVYSVHFHYAVFKIIKQKRVNAL